MKVKVGNKYRVYWNNKNNTNGFTYGAIYTIAEIGNNLVRFKGYNYWHNLNDIRLEYATWGDIIDNVSML